MAIRVLVVDDHEIMRAGVCALLRRCKDLEVIGQAADGRFAVELVNQLHPDLVIMDIKMPTLNGIDATRQMIRLNPSLKIMILTANFDEDIIARTFQAGAQGCMLKESAFAELKEGIKTLLKGRTFLCSRISREVPHDYIRKITNPQLTMTERLSQREREVLQFIAEGHSSKEIAQVFQISPKTVDTHRQHIMLKLDIRTIPGLTKYAIQKGLTTL